MLERPYARREGTVKRRLSLVATMQEVCESCGREFGCGADGEEPCWCAEVELDAQRLAVLREHFERCLCPDCLTVAGAASRR